MRNKFIFLLLCLVLFMPYIVKADDCNSNDIVIEQIEINNINGSAEELNEPLIENKKIILDLQLYDPGDYIEYSVKVKNNSDKDVSFDESSFKFNSDYIDYSFSYEDDTNTIKSKTEKIIKIKIEYKNKVPTDKLENDVFNVKDEMTIILSNLVNPKTGLISSIFYIVIILIAIALLFALIKSKSNAKYVLFIAGLSLVFPILVNALCEYDIEINSNILINGKEAMFLPGSEVNVKIKKLAGDVSVNNSSVLNTNIKNIKYSQAEPLDANKEDKNIVSTEESPYPIYMWYDNEILYWWSEDKTPALNSDTSSMFEGFSNLTDIIGLTNFDASESTNIASMFKNTALESLNPLKKWDVSNVIDMNSIFLTVSNLTTLDGLENWNVSNVKNMNYAFANSQKIANIRSLSKWDTSSVEKMEWTFANLFALETLEGLENWDVSNVESLYCTFLRNFAVTSLKPLSNWNVSNVKNMNYTFASLDTLETLEGLENWDVSNVEGMYATFAIGASEYTAGHRSSLKEVNALRNWNVEKVTSIGGFFQLCEDLESIEGIQNWNVSNVKDMSSVFRGCKSITDISPIVNWDTSNLKNINSMFNDCDLLEELDLSNFDLSNVTSSNYFITGTINLKRLKTPKVYPTNIGVKIELPKNFYDSNHNSYTVLDNTSPVQTWLSVTDD